MGNIRGQFGIFAETSGAASGVTSVTAGTGLTGGTITATGTITRDPNTDLTGTQSADNNLAGRTSVPTYANGTYPNSNVTQDYNNRTSINFRNTTTSSRWGFGGIAMFDLINISGTIETDCTTGAMTFTAANGGVFNGVPFTTTPTTITCNGSFQSRDFAFANFRVGSNDVAPTNGGSDYFQINLGSTYSGGDIRVDNVSITIDTFTDS